MKMTRDPMRCKTAPECRGSLDTMRYPAFVDVKYDGEFTVYVKKVGHSGKLLNKHGAVREGLITAQLDSMVPADLDINIIGELTYLEGLKGDLYSLLTNKVNDDVLRFCAFDIQNDDALIDRKELLSTMLRPTETIRIGKSWVANSPDEVKYFFDSAKLLGYEGVVAKAFDTPYIVGPCSWVKIKDKDTNNYPIVMIDPVKERIEVLVQLPDKKRNCGVKASNKIKPYLRVGDLVTIEHQGILEQGGLRHPVLVGRAKEEENEINGN